MGQNGIIAYGLFITNFLIFLRGLVLLIFVFLCAYFQMPSITDN